MLNTNPNRPIIGGITSIPIFQFDYAKDYSKGFEIFKASNLHYSNTLFMKKKPFEGEIATKMTQEQHNQLMAKKNKYLEKEGSKDSNKIKVISYVNQNLIYGYMLKKDSREDGKLIFNFTPLNELDLFKLKLGLGACKKFSNPQDKLKTINQKTEIQGKTPEEFMFVDISRGQHNYEGVQQYVYHTQMETGKIQTNQSYVVYRSLDQMNLFVYTLNGLNIDQSSINAETIGLPILFFSQIIISKIQKETIFIVLDNINSQIIIFNQSDLVQNQLKFNKVVIQLNHTFKTFH